MLKLVLLKSVIHGGATASFLQNAGLADAKLILYLVKGRLRLLQMLLLSWRDSNAHRRESLLMILPHSFLIRHLEGH